MVQEDALPKDFRMNPMRAEELRERRTRAGLTQGRLSDLSGVSISTIGKIERGYTGATPVMLARLERTLAELSDDPYRELLEAAKEARDELEQYQARWMEVLAEKLDAAIRSVEARA